MRGILLVGLALLSCLGCLRAQKEKPPAKLEKLGAIDVTGVVQPVQTDIVVNATDLSSLSFVASGTDVLYARVWDGYTWSARAKVTIAVNALDQAPIVSTSAVR